jgi:hypothetical protein
MYSTRRFLLLFFIVALVLSGCSESTSPPAATDDPTGGAQEFEGSIDPAEGTFVLKSLQVPVPDAEPVRIELIGEFLRVDPAGEIIGIKIAIRNADRRPIHPRVEVVARDFIPQAVTIIDADWTNCPPDAAGPLPVGGCHWGFDYSMYLGNDEVLEPGETSEPRAWAFHVPGLVPFRFAATVRVSLVPQGAAISGIFFLDANQNGQIDRGEEPLPAGSVHVRGPEGFEMRAGVGEGGRYVVPIKAVGLYSVTAFPPPTMDPLGFHFTTPNPLEVVITPDSSGSPRSFPHAHFGLYRGPSPPPPPPPNDCPPGGFFPFAADSLLFDQYHLGRVALDDKFLKLRVGFSGCGPDHPFMLWAVDGFMESDTVQVRLKLGHDDRDELCDAYWERTLCYDLEPLRAEYRRVYGAPGVLYLIFEDWYGEVTRFVLEVPPADPATGR